MRICIAQTRIRAGALQHNFAAMRRAIEKAHEARADVVVFPEMALPGYFVGDAWERHDFLRQCEDFCAKIAALSGEMAIVFGSIGVDAQHKNEDGRMRKYNAAFVAQHGRLIRNTATGLPFWCKALMPNYREFDDSRHFFDLRKLALERNVPLATLFSTAPIQTRDGSTKQLALSLCEDAWDNDYACKPWEMICNQSQRPDLLINLSCSPFTQGKQEKRRKLFTQKAKQFGLPIVYVNAIGSQNVGKTIFSFDGQSGVYVGEQFFSAAAPFQEAVVSFKLSEASSLNSGQDNRPLRRSEELLLALEHGLRFIREEWNLERVVLGVSGGIDSALSAVVHARVFGEKNLSCVNLPSQYNSQLTQNAAQKLAQNLGCAYASLSIEESVALTLRQLADARAQGLAIPNSLAPLVGENIQARDRGSRLIAAVASALSAVFPCNANKSELTVGYSTLYGDQAGYLAPLADLWKSDVYALAEYYNAEIFAREVIPSETISVVPSAELSAEQDVTQGRGDPLIYDYHDALFRLWVEEWNRFDFDSTLAAWDNGSLGKLLGPKAAEILSGKFNRREDFEKDLKRWWNAYVSMGAFKRMQAPPVLALTRRAFGFDHRENIGLNWMR